MLTRETKQILITVKAYPNPSKKYGETVCCAGVDLKTYQWVRLFPIPFRDLDSDKKFNKYSIIEVDCSKPRDDTRPESYYINIDSLKVVRWLDTEKGVWGKRKTIVLKLPVKSMCQVYKDAADSNLSLGLIKPDNVTFHWTKQSVSDQRSREACYAQLSFFNRRKNAVDKIPYNFYYDFKCRGDDDCPGHRLSIIDWELGQAYRDWKSIYSSESLLLEKIQQRWLSMASTETKDVYFYVGNMLRFRKTFMVLGVFYPRK